MKKNDFGVWEVTVPAKDGIPIIPHNSKVKVRCSDSLPPSHPRMDGFRAEKN